MAKQKYTDAMFLQAIKGSGGIMSTIASRLGCSWDTARYRIDRHEGLRKAYENECEGILDVAEGVVMHNIQLAYNKQAAQAAKQTPPLETELVDTTDAKWYLKNKGRKRGYVERTENVDITEHLIEILDGMTEDEFNKVQQRLATGQGAAPKAP